MTSKIKNRILFLCEKRAFHICSVIGLTDGSILITPSLKVKVVEKLRIKMVESNPKIESTEKTNLPSLHATFHPRTGFKHIRIDDGEVLVKFNMEKVRPKDIFEGLVRIFPTIPTKYPFISVTKKTDFLIPLKSWVNHPMSLLFQVMSYSKDQLRVEAPYGTQGFVIPIGKLNVVCIIMPMSVDNVFISEWPSETLWTTPY